MNTFKRKLWIALFAIVALGGCAADKQYGQLVQDTNDRIERARKADAEADAAIGRALEKAAEYEPGIVAAVASNVLMARALKGAKGSEQAFLQPERPRDFFDKLESVSRVASNLVNAATPIGLAMEAGRTARAGYQRDLGIESARQGGETARITSVAQISRDVAAGRPNQVYNIGRDGVIGGGTQQNDNSVTDRHDTVCTAGSGASGGAGGGGGSGGAGATSPGAAGAPGAAGGSGGNAC